MEHATPAASHPHFTPSKLMKFIQSVSYASLNIGAVITQAPFLMIAREYQNDQYEKMS